MHYYDNYQTILLEQKNLLEPPPSPMCYPTVCSQNKGLRMFFSKHGKEGLRVRIIMDV